MKIGFTGPGDFKIGWNSKVRGEGRWLMSMAFALQNEHKVYIIKQDNDSNYVEEKVNFVNINDAIQKHEFDILLSMDVFIDEPDKFHKSHASEYVSKIEATNKIWAPFFSSNDHKETNHKVVYPYWCKQTDNEHSFTLPICLGNTDDLEKEDNFNKPYAVWFSKNPHENPEYLYTSFKYIIEHLNNFDMKLIAVDGKRFLDRDYPNKDKVRKLIEQNKNRLVLLSEWIDYGKMYNILKDSKFICGIQHPISNPMQLDIVFSGGIPVIYKNQASLPPFYKAIFPYLNESNEKESYEILYNTILSDRDEYKKVLYTLRKEANYYTIESLKNAFNNLLGKL